MVYNRTGPWTPERIRREQLEQARIVLADEIEEAVAAEREACAKIADGHAVREHGGGIISVKSTDALVIAAAIRAREKTK